MVLVIRNEAWTVRRPPARAAHALRGRPAIRPATPRLVCRWLPAADGRGLESHWAEEAGQWFAPAASRPRRRPPAASRNHQAVARLPTLLRVAAA